MAEIRQTLRASKMLNKAYEYCKKHRHEFVMPEHLLLALAEDLTFCEALIIFDSTQHLDARVKEYLENVESIYEDMECGLETLARR